MRKRRGSYPKALLPVRMFQAWRQRGLAVQMALGCAAGPGSGGAVHSGYAGGWRERGGRCIQRRSFRSLPFSAREFSHRLTPSRSRLSHPPVRLCFHLLRRQPGSGGDFDCLIPKCLSKIRRSLARRAFSPFVLTLWQRSQASLRSRGASLPPSSRQLGCSRCQGVPGMILWLPMWQTPFSRIQTSRRTLSECFLRTVGRTNSWPFMRVSHSPAPAGHSDP